MTSDPGLQFFWIVAYLLGVALAFLILYYVIKAAVRDGFQEFNDRRTRGSSTKPDAGE